MTTATLNGHASSALHEVTRSAPCPICAKPDWCARFDDGGVLCERRADPPPGWRKVKGRGDGGIFRPDNGVQVQRPSPRKKKDKPKKAYPTLDAAIAAGARQVKGKFIAPIETYHRADGTDHFHVARFDLPEIDLKTGKPKKKFLPFHHDGRGFVIGDPLGPLSLFNLTAIEGAARLFVTEGEKACRATQSLELAATTSAHGSKSAGKSDWRPAAKADEVVIVVDADEAGEQFGRDAATILYQSGCKRVKILRLPALRPGSGDDIVEFIADRRMEGKDDDAIRAEIEALADTAEVFVPEPDDNASFHEDSGEKVSQAEVVVRLAQREYRFGVTEAGEPFAVKRGGPSIAMMFRGSRDALRAQLAKRYRQECGRTPNATALADALTVLHGTALDADLEEAHLRFAVHDDAIIIDLGTHNGQAVEVSGGGWRVIERAPILFRRSALTAALPTPARGGNVEALRTLINVTPETWPLILGWAVAAFMPAIPRPILMLNGMQGAGKSTAARMLIGVIDPSPAPLQSEPRDSETWAVTATAKAVLAIDNVSSISAWWSDALCKAVTGDGLVRRRLYSDSDTTVFSFKRAMMLTSIDAGALRGDLGDRIVMADLESIDSRQRMAEAELNQRYEAARAAIFGGLLDVLVRVLQRLPSVTLDELPRMADFARVLAALDLEGITNNAFTTYMDQAGRIGADVVEGDVVASSIVGMVEQAGLWCGTAGELLDAIRPEKPGKAWPANARAMSGRLKRLVPALGSVGVKAEYLGPTGRTKTRLWEIEKVGAQPSAPSAPSANAPDAAMKTDLAADGTADGRETAHVNRPHCDQGLYAAADGRSRAEANRPHDRPRQNTGKTGVADGADGADGPNGEVLEANSPTDTVATSAEHSY